MKKNLSKLTKQITILTILILITGTKCGIVHAQAQIPNSHFVVIEYLKVNPGDHSRYLDVEQQIWKPMHQERINQGIILSWRLYAVEFTGSADDYNYVTITIYDDPAKLENPWNADIPAKVHRNMSVEEIMDRTNKARDYVRSESYYCVASVPENPLKDPARYIQVNFMKVKAGMEPEYEELEQNTWMSIHNESIKQGKTVGWGLLSALFPRGEGRPYQYVTLNTFSDYSYVFELDFSVPFKAIHPDKDYREMIAKTEEARTLMRSELWDLIDYVIK
jgi:hypothetical protein